MTDVCTHLDTIRVASLPESVPGCEDCLGSSWCPPVIGFDPQPDAEQNVPTRPERRSHESAT